MWTGEQRQAFVTLLGTGRPAIPVIEALDNVGVWVKLLPEWAPARSRPQHNPYHGYTVDRHLLETVAVAATIPSDRRDLLLLAALLHDLGKAYPGDHSDVGADLAARILRRMGVVDDDVETIVIAVREHLLLPDTATRRDLDDPVTLTEVARRIGRVDRLDLLAQLALADGLATGPTAWSDWKAKLVDELVSRVRALMSGEKPASLVSIAPFPPHIEELARAAEPGEVVVEAQGNRLVVVATDRPGLFSALCGAVAVHGLDIRDARIGSLDGVAVDELVVESSFEEEIRWDRVVDDIRAAAVGDVPLDQRLADRANAYHRRPVPHTLPTAVHILDGDGDGSAIVEVVGADSLGLLYRLSRVFAALQLDITRALVTTVGGDFVDVFYIDDQGRGTLDDLDTRSTLRTHLVDAIHERF